MATTSEIPVTISADAEERVRELGMQREFEAMLEHTRQTVPGLCAIEISSFFFDGASEQCLLITASEKSPRLEGCDPVRREWYDWLIDTFPPAIVEWFLFVVDYETDHAG